MIYTKLFRERENAHALEMSNKTFESDLDEAAEQLEKISKENKKLKSMFSTKITEFTQLVSDNESMLHKVCNF